MARGCAVAWHLARARVLTGVYGSRGGCAGVWGRGRKTRCEVLGVGAEGGAFARPGAAAPRGASPKLSAALEQGDPMSLEQRAPRAGGPMSLEQRAS
ncbi:hypothetical protein GCM10010234_22180 [Streptomyces hawaiiensis]